MSPRRRLPTLGHNAVVEIDGRHYGVSGAAPEDT